jgi:inner membrane protein
MVIIRMEPLTHFLTGACIGRAGLNRKTACATVVATLAAEAADLDIFWGFKGPVEELKHHRGITHTFIAAPFLAALIVVVIGFAYKGLEARRERKRTQTAIAGEPPPLSRKPPLRWLWLYAVGLIAALSHILLDWATSYGVRPFFPFNPHWYAGSFVFIAEPVLWALFFLAFAIPWLLGLADREIGVRRPVFRGRG